MPEAVLAEAFDFSGQRQQRPSTEARHPLGSLSNQRLAAVMRTVYQASQLSHMYVLVMTATQQTHLRINATHPSHECHCCWMVADAHGIHSHVMQSGRPFALPYQCWSSLCCCSIAHALSQPWMVSPEAVWVGRRRWSLTKL